MAVARIDMAEEAVMFAFFGIYETLGIEGIFGQNEGRGKGGGSVAWHGGDGGGGKPVAGVWRGSWAGIAPRASDAVAGVLCGGKRMARKLARQKKTPGTLRRRGFAMFCVAYQGLARSHALWAFSSRIRVSLM